MGSIIVPLQLALLHKLWGESTRFELIVPRISVAKKAVLRMGLPDKTRDFTEKTEAIFKKVASFCKKGSEGVSLSLMEGAKAAAEKGLTALAKFVMEQRNENRTSVAWKSGRGNIFLAGGGFFKRLPNIGNRRMEARSW
ncbi:MAG: hypothetical protein LBF25_03300 [Puniceicoccales bacterium]|jgi:hypothetical protein|nr:hypothetical protein [Puniceicoccales bacterium]